MSDEKWLLTPAGTRLSWTRRKHRDPKDPDDHLPWAGGVIALDPVRRVVLTDEGREISIDQFGANPHIEFGPTFLPADPGWRKCWVWFDKDAGEWKTDWMTIIAWKVDHHGYLIGGVATDDEYGIELSTDVDDNHPSFYWHVSEGMERQAQVVALARAELERQAEMEELAKKIRKERAEKDKAEREAGPVSGA